MTEVSLNTRVTRLVQYLNELSQLRQKPVMSYKKYEEVLWFCKDIPNEPECIDAFRDNTEDWLYVKRPKHPIEPKLPTKIKDWVTTDNRNYSYKIQKSILKENVIDEEVVETEIFLSDLPEIQMEIDHFIEEKWDAYAIESKRARKIQDLYDKLFTIFQYIQNNSESVELVLSIGLLQWKSNSKNSVERHALISPVELHFNKEKAEFFVTHTSKGKVFEYEEDMLLVENRLQGDGSKEIQRLLTEINSESELIPQLENILENISNALDSRGAYNDTLEIPTVGQINTPLISLSPALVLRKKTQKGFQKACENAVQQLEHLTDDSQIPSNLKNMFLSPENVDQDNENGTANNENEFSVKEFYFPLPSNEEQSRIISTLSSNNSVLVQGPPGTGKTHTIANLTSHLLASGKKILITSQTAKALSVLKKKLPPELQDLTVSLLGGDSAAIKDLEKVVGTISINKEQFDLTKNKLLVEQNELKLKSLKQQLNITKTKLFEIREAETYTHNFNSVYKGTAKEVAEKVNGNANLYSWYSSDVTRDTPESFWEKEKQLVSDYLELNQMPFDVPEEYNKFGYPTIPETIRVDKIIESIKEILVLNAKQDSIKALSIETIQNNLMTITDSERESLKIELQELNKLKRPLLYNSYPKLEIVINEIFMNKGNLWQEILNNAKKHLQVIQKYNDEADEQLFDTGSLSTAEVRKMAEDLYAHIQNGGNLGNFLIKPKIVREYKTQLEQVKYNGSTIKNNKQVEILYSYAQLRHAKEQIKELLVPRFLNDELPNALFLLSEYENAIDQLSKAQKVNEWREAVLSKFTFLARDSFNEEKVSKILDNITIYEIEVGIRNNRDYLESAKQELIRLISEETHPLYKDLIDDIASLEVESTQKNISLYKHYQEVMKRDNTLNDIITHLKKESHSLGETLEKTYDDPVWENRLLVWQKAFEWKQAKNWIDEFSSRSESEVSEKFDDIDKEISETITETGTTKAWINMLQSMTVSQNKHLKAWVKSVGNIGKGTGKNAAKYRAEAQKHMEYCIDAIPAWIMPLSQVFDHFEIKPNLFDVVIIDEASQSWHDALLLKYIAKKMIIVGDDKQISPTIIGVNDDDVTKLQRKYFKDINFPFGSDLNLKNSFFDICYIMFKDTITLREHFRCMPEIIGFSNRISYQDKPLVPLRQYPSNRLEPIKSVYLPHGVRVGSSQNATNEVEADAIVQEIKNCINNPKYDGKTIGVISLLGSGQATLIQTKLLNEIGAELIEERKIICGDAYSFQGDERDVIFLTMVAAKGATRITSLADEKARQRFNVSVSRAKDQLWLMHSITVNDISNRDCMRYQLLSYVMDPLKEETESNRSKCESDFERRVFDSITSKGFRVIPQYNVAGYFIDLVVMGEKTKLAVECDGDYWHTSPEDRERDFLRERVLQRAGWTFWRILGSTYYNNPVKSLESLWETLEEMGIKPFLEWKEAESEDNILDELAATTEVTTSEKDNYNQIEVPSRNTEDDSNLVNFEEMVSIKNKKEHNEDEQPLIHQEDEGLNEDINRNENTLNPKHEKYIVLLRKKGFEVLQDNPPSNTIYVAGTEVLRKELENIAPRNNSFTFHEKGFPISDGLPVWSMTLETKVNDNQPIVNTELDKKKNATNEDNQIQKTPSQMLKELKNAGYQIIDNRYISETVWLIGGEELLPIIEDFKRTNTIFRYLEKGHSLTNYKPAWFAKMKREKRK
ncbi:AAA domain-containing protein [Oceanobacillus damuensis]|uniref:AAA domain-containing protein n=1 Tax=Oceanobacillus damuensis TaxID=937928 RepID=UPI00082E5953|nr:AAA domain-containing protein [Oceanobacillus damuensis]